MTDEVNEIPSRFAYRLALLKNAFNPLEEPVRTHTLVGLAALSVGVGVGYILGKRQNTIVIDEFPQQLEIDFDTSNFSEYVNEKINSGTTYIQENNDEEEPQEPDAIIAMDVLEEEISQGSDSRSAAAQFIQDRIQQAIQEHQAPDEEPAPEEVVSNIFARGNDDGWDYEAEKKKRNTNEPYVIHRDEFWNDEQGYTQLTLTYYAGDDIMVDEEDAPIYNYQQVTGPLLFGHGSEDANVFHVRNDKRRAEYEIIRDEGLFSVEVLGLQIEDNVRARDLKHSDTRRFKLE